MCECFSSNQCRRGTGILPAIFGCLNHTRLNAPHIASHPPKAPSCLRSRSGGAPPPVILVSQLLGNFPLIRRVHPPLASMVKLCLTKFVLCQKRKLLVNLAHRPASCRGPLCRAAIIVPAPREASGDVSRSLLLGSELKFLHALHGQSKVSSSRHFFVPLFMKNGANHHQPQ